jgi:hypothetical protein
VPSNTLGIISRLPVGTMGILFLVCIWNRILSFVLISDSFSGADPGYQSQYSQSFWQPMQGQHAFQTASTLTHQDLSQTGQRASDYYGNFDPGYQSNVEPVGYPPYHSQPGTGYLHSTQIGKARTNFLPPPPSTVQSPSSTRVYNTRQLDPCK